MGNEPYQFPEEDASPAVPFKHDDTGFDLDSEGNWHDRSPRDDLAPSPVVPLQPQQGHRLTPSPLRLDQNV
eukprot:13647511-Alexandrium_andersonii.AAC.1